MITNKKTIDESKKAWASCFLAVFFFCVGLFFDLLDTFWV